MRHHAAAATLAALAALAVLAAAAPPARAQQGDDPVAQARQYFEAGRQAYEKGQYVVAIAAFEEAHRLSQRPSVVFALGQAFRRQYFVDHDPAKLKRAVELYGAYVAAVPDGPRRSEAVQYLSELEPLLARVEDEERREGRGAVESTPPPPQRTQLMVSSRTPGATASIDGGPLLEVPVVQDVAAGKRRIRVQAPGHFPDELDGVAVDGRLVVVPVELRPRPARLEVRAPAGSSIAVDGRRAGTTPLAGPLELPAGRHLVTVARRGHRPFARELRLDRGQEAVLAADLPRTRQRYASYWVLGGAGALLLAGGTTTGLAFAAQADAGDISDRMRRENVEGADLDAYNDAIDRRDALRVASGVLYGGALAVAATGVLLYFLDDATVETPRFTGPVLTPAVGNGAVGLTWRGGF